MLNAGTLSHCGVGKLFTATMMMQLLCLTVTHLQLFVRRDPVSPHPEDTDDVMFVRQELRLL